MLGGNKVHGHKVSTHAQNQQTVMDREQTFFGIVFLKQDCVSLAQGFFGLVW